MVNPPARFLIEWGASSVVVKGEIPPQTIPQKVFFVQVEQADLRSGIGLPVMDGRYEVTGVGISFEPRFPFEAGVRYRATFQMEGLKTVSSVLEIPRTARVPSTVVTEIYPTAELLPENLLKFYVYFSASMSGGHIYEHIRLTDESGKAVELPFLEIDEELWNAEMTRLTLFLDPGRIKRGVKPLEEVGPALEEGKRYTLSIARAWLDATGTQLKADFRKEFRVGAADREAPDLAKWEITAPMPGTRQPLKVVFTDSLDHALALRMIAVGGVPGEARIAEQERVWLFTPDEPWRTGKLKLRVQSTIEDLAGNNVGKPFEVDLFERVEKRVTREIVEREFEVR